jgi:hypothetical protein
MRLSRKQKIAMMISLCDLGHTLFPDEEATLPQWDRARACMAWLRHRLEIAEADGMATPVAAHGRGVFALDISEGETADAIIVLMEAVIAAEEPDNGAPNRPHA